jgi:hypothetical protein
VTEQHNPSVQEHRGPIAAAAAFLELDERELRRRLASGRTLGQVAVEEGRPIEGLEDALLEDLKWHLDADVAGGRVSTEREAQILAAVKRGIDQMVERKRRIAAAAA